MYMSPLKINSIGLGIAPWSSNYIFVSGEPSVRGNSQGLLKSDD